MAQSTTRQCLSKSDPKSRRRFDGLLPLLRTCGPCKAHSAAFDCDDVINTAHVSIHRRSQDTPSLSSSRFLVAKGDSGHWHPVVRRGRKLVNVGSSCILQPVVKQGVAGLSADRIVGYFAKQDAVHHRHVVPSNRICDGVGCLNYQEEAHVSRKGTKGT